MQNTEQLAVAAYSGRTIMKQIEAMKRAEGSKLENPEARKIASRIREITLKIGDEVDTLNGEIQDAKSKRAMKEDAVSRLASQSWAASTARSEAKKLRKNVEDLVSKRDKLIDDEISEAELKSLANRLVKCYDDDTRQRAKDIKKHLTAACEILSIQFAQATLYEQTALAINNRLNSSKLSKMMAGFSGRHYFGGFIGLTFTHGISWLLDAVDMLEGLADDFDKL